MKVSSVTTFILTTAMGVAADNCKVGLNYCGSTLLKIGNYRGQIQQAFIASGMSWRTDPDDWIFQCIGGPEGLIKVAQDCPTGCVDRGENQSDTCA